MLDADNRVMGYSPEPRHRGDLYPLICSIVSGDKRKQLQIADAQTEKEFQANNSHLGDQPEHNLTQAAEGSIMNSGQIRVHCVTTGHLLPDIKRKNPSEEPGQILSDSELSRKFEKNQNSKKLKKHNLIQAAEG